MFDMGNFCTATIGTYLNDGGPTCGTLRGYGCNFFADTYIKNSRLALLGAIFGNEPHARE